MASDAAAQQPQISPSGRGAAGAAPGRPRGTRGIRILQATGGLLLAAWIGMAIWHTTKPLPAGMRVAGPWEPIATDQARLLVDVTTADGYGRPVIQQEIFDETLAVIASARAFIVLDQFLLNDHRGALERNSLNPLRPLSRELADALVAARQRRPTLRVLLITDPINDVYGGDPSTEFARLEQAGVEVVRTDLDPLRDSNPAYSALWRLAVRWWGPDGRGRGWLPSPMEEGPERVSFRAWARLLNFKANHRKVLIADDGGTGLVGIVGSANPHDASSAHSNLALQLRGAALRPLLESEMEIARASGWRGLALPVPATGATTLTRAAAAASAGPSGATAGAGAGETAMRARALTEGAIRDELLARIAATRAGDRIDIAMFYLSERTLIGAMLDAAARGVELRLLLDPNKDAFGREKSGIPNRPVASELVAKSDGAIKLRWYRTHGEQFHTKLVMVRHDGRVWLTTGSANLTRRNIGDFNLEANLALEAAASAPIALAAARYFETLWTNRAPAGIEYSADFGTYADPAQSSYWAYRIMEASGLSTF
jgi:phosphatidylserine/phosphatidylglycerophosphate/cardiolipin synthase-like enzyme